MFQVERSLLAGRHSDRFDPSFTELGLFAKRSPPDTAFIVGDWGVGAAIQCLGNGRPGLLYEPFWDYRGNDDLSSILSRCSTRVFYLVTRRPLSNVRPNNTRRLLEDISRRSDLRESPVEPTLLRLHAVEVRRFVRAPGTTCGRGLVSPAVAQWPR